MLKKAETVWLTSWTLEMAYTQPRQAYKPCSHPEEIVSMVSMDEITKHIRNAPRQLGWTRAQMAWAHLQVGQKVQLNSGCKPVRISKMAQVCQNYQVET